MQNEFLTGITVSIPLAFLVIFKKMYDDAQDRFAKRESEWREERKEFIVVLDQTQKTMAYLTDSIVRHLENKR